MFVPSSGNEFRPRILGRGSIALILGLMLAAEGFLVATVIARNSGGDFLASVEQGAVIAFTNDDRAQYLLPGLRESAALDAAAQAKARDMADKGYFSHVGPDGAEPWKWIEEAGYGYTYAGENLAVHFSDSSEVVDAWMASPSHRQNILASEYSDIGVGIANGLYKGEPATFVVQFFASPNAQNAAAALQPLESGSFWNNMFKIASAPNTAATLVLSALLLLLIIALLLTFFVRIQIQPGNLLLSGAAAAGFALVLISANAYLLPVSTEITPQAASVAMAPVGFPQVALEIDTATSTRPELVQ